MKPKTVGIRVLKDRLSAYVRGLAEGGEEVVVTDRGRAVARLVGVGSSPTQLQTPMRIRPAAKDRSDMGWMRRGPARGKAVRPLDISRAIDFTRGDKELP